MIVCGIEIKSFEAIIAIISCDLASGTVSRIESAKKVSLNNDEDCADVRSTYSAFESLLRANGVTRVAVKKRAHKGKFAGGAISFKIEGLIQMQNVSPVTFVSGQALSAAERREPYKVPSGFVQYQNEAAKTAIYVARGCQ